MLMFQINRTDFDKKNFQLLKLNDHFDFPEKLEMNDFKNGLKTPENISDLDNNFSVDFLQKEVSEIKNYIGKKEMQVIVRSNEGCQAIIQEAQFRQL